MWGHLTLLALRTGRESEATLVYKEALKLGLSDVPLLRSIGEQQLALGKYTLVTAPPTSQTRDLTHLDGSPATDKCLLRPESSR